jgi:hypothetical protein
MKDYLHFYIGQDVDVLRKYPNGDSQVLKLILDAYTYMNIVDGSFKDSEVKLLLRPLSDMSEEEAVEMCKINTPEYRWDCIEIFDISGECIWYMDGSRSQGDGFDEANDLYIYFEHLNAKEFAYLLSKGFDVFGLKEKGLAIYKTDVK